MFKKALVIILAIGMMTLTIGCGESNKKENPNQKTNQKQSENVKKVAAKQVVRPEGNIEEKKQLTTDVTKKTYVGRFVLRDKVSPFYPAIANHLIPANNNQYVNKAAYPYYDVYCEHDHTTDYFRSNGEVDSMGSEITAYIIPLNINAKPVGKVMVSEIPFRTKGGFGIAARKLFIYGLNDKELESVSILDYMEPLFSNTALASMVKVTGPHPKNGLERFDGHKFDEKYYYTRDPEIVKVK